MCFRLWFKCSLLSWKATAYLSPYKVFQQYLPFFWTGWGILALLQPLGNSQTSSKGHTFSNQHTFWDQGLRMWVVGGGGECRQLKTLQSFLIIFNLLPLLFFFFLVVLLCLIVNLWLFSWVLTNLVDNFCLLFDVSVRVRSLKVHALPFGWWHLPR